MSAPQLRGLLMTRASKQLVVASVSSIIAGCAWYGLVMRRRTQRYDEFWKHYDAQKDFERMREAGVFHSVAPGGALGEREW